METNDSIITVQNLVKRYKKAKENAVDDISFAVKRGEFFSLLGPNGAGKTTTISILTTTLSKTSGEVRVAEYDIDKEASKVRRSVGIIFQNPSLDLNLTAEENIRMHAVLYGIYPFSPRFKGMPESYKTRIYSLAGILNLSNDIFKPIRTFSGGMKRKLEIMRSLMHKPQVLFLDEPTVGLDPESRQGLWEYLQEVRKSDGTTIFLTTHYLDEVESADRVCIINHGKVVALDAPGALKREMVAEYLLLDAEDRLKLRVELEQQGLRVEDLPPFKVRLEGRTAQEVIRKIETPLSVLKIHAPTLEEAYLSIIGETGKLSHE